MSKTTATLSLFLLILAIHFNTSVAFAAKPRAKAATPTTGTTTKVAATGFSSAKLSRGTNSVIVNFVNLDKASKVSYILAYTSNGLDQGAAGSVNPTGTTDSRDLYFGTCSHGVCTPHRNITNASLTITTTLKSGGTNTKRYRIKI